MCRRRQRGCAGRRSGRDGNCDEDDTSLFRQSERERCEDEKGVRGRTGRTWMGITRRVSGRERERETETSRGRSTTRREGGGRIARARRRKREPATHTRDRDGIPRMAKAGVAAAVLDWRTNARETRTSEERERAGGGEGRRGRGSARGTRRTHGRAGWMGAGTVFKRKEKERGESSEWLVHY